MINSVKQLIFFLVFTLYISANTIPTNNAFIHSNNSFALKFLNQIEAENSIFSALSITALFSNLAIGAEEKTKDEIFLTFNINSSKTLQNDIKPIIETLSSYEKNQLNISNSMWIDDRFKILPKFLTISSTYFKSSIISSGFSKNPTKEEERINSYVAKKTNNLITDIIPKNSLSKTTPLVLINTMYFKGKWETEFNPSQSIRETFYVTKNVEVPVTMMRRRQINLNYFENSLLKIVELPYQNNNFSLFIIVPNTSLNSLISTLSLDQFNTIKKRLKKQTLSISIPKLSLSSNFELNSTLESMGLKSAFKESANFSNITKENNIYIDKANHKAVLELSEEGTTAAAATSITMGLKTTSIAKQFKANRPFLLILLENNTNGIIFLGKISNPSSLRN